MASKARVFVTIDLVEGGLRRWETGGAQPRITHFFRCSSNPCIERDVIQVMIFEPPEHLAVGVDSEC